MEVRLTIFSARIVMVGWDVVIEPLLLTSIIFEETLRLELSN